MLKTKGVNAVDRALSVLEAFGQSEGVLSPHEIAARTGLNKATILRLLVSLEGHGYVSRLGVGQYSLGPAPFHLGRIYQRSFRLSDFVIPTLQTLVERTNETALFYIKDGENRVCLHVAESPNTMREQLREGEIRPLSQSRVGCVLRVFSGEDLPEAEALRRDFVLVNSGLRHPDLSSINCPVFRNGSELVGAVSVSGLSTHFLPPQRDMLCAILLEEVARLTQRLGGDASGLIAARNRYGETPPRTERAELTSDLGAPARRAAS